MQFYHILTFANYHFPVQTILGQKCCWFQPTTNQIREWDQWDESWAMKACEHKNKNKNIYYVDYLAANDATKKIFEESLSQQLYPRKCSNHSITKEM